MTNEITIEEKVKLLLMSAEEETDMLQFKIKPGLKKLVAYQAEKEGKSVARIVKVAITDYLIKMETIK